MNGGLTEILRQFSRFDSV